MMRIFTRGRWLKNTDWDDKRIMTTGHLEDAIEFFVREGQSFVVRRVKSPLKDENVEIVGILGVFWEINEESPGIFWIYY